MNLYWFSDEDGHFWKIMAALNEKRAWKLLVHEESDLLTIEEAKKKYELDAVTAVSENEGVVASIFPLEVNFTIRDGFGSKELGHLRNI